MNNQRTFEFFVIAGILGIGAPCAVLMGALNGERTAAIAYPKVQAEERFAVDYKSIVMGSPDDEERGKAIFQANCVACHGPMADGKGAAAAALTPPPRNFLDPNARWTRSREPKDIYQTLTEGSPGTAMVGFSAMLSVQDRWALVHYLGTLPGVHGKFHPVDEAMASAWRPEARR